MLNMLANQTKRLNKREKAYTYVDKMTDSGHNAGIALVLLQKKMHVNVITILTSHYLRLRKVRTFLQKYAAVYIWTSMFLQLHFDM